MTKPRTLADVQNDLAALAMAHHGLRPAPASSAAKARALAAEAFELGRAEARQEGRKALGKAWSAVLDMIPAEFWEELPYTDPELCRRFRKFALGEPP
jgi:hypothetical protein